MGRPKLYTSAEDMERDIDNYFKYCEKQKKPYTMCGLANALDMSRQSLINYSNDNEFFDTIKRARSKVEQQLEENALLGKANSTFTIFNLKNNFNWKDVVENQVSSNGILGELKEALNNDKNNQ